MRQRRFRRAAGGLMLLLALALEGRVFFSVQGSTPVMLLTSGRVSGILARRMPDGGYTPLMEPVAVEGASPGQNIACAPAVCMDDSAGDAWLRARIRVTGVSAGQAAQIERRLSQPRGWNYNAQDGFYYYRYLVREGTSIPVFTSVHIPEKWKGTDSFQIEVAAEAAEASRITPVVGIDGEILRWAETEEAAP